MNIENILSWAIAHGSSWYYSIYFVYVWNFPQLKAQNTNCLTFITNTQPQLLLIWKSCLKSTHMFDLSQDRLKISLSHNPTWRKKLDIFSFLGLCLNKYGALKKLAHNHQILFYRLRQSRAPSEQLCKLRVLLVCSIICNFFTP